MNAKEMPMAVTRPIRAASCDAPTSPVSPRCGGGSLQIPSFILAAAPTASLSGLWGLLLRRGHGCGHLRGSLSVCAAAASAPNVALFPRQRLHLLQAVAKQRRVRAKFHVCFCGLCDSGHGDGPPFCG